MTTVITLTSAGSSGAYVRSIDNVASVHETGLSRAYFKVFSPEGVHHISKKLTHCLIVVKDDVAPLYDVRKVEDVVNTLRIMLMPNQSGPGLSLTQSLANYQGAFKAEALKSLSFNNVDIRLRCGVFLEQSDFEDMLQVSLPGMRIFINTALIPIVSVTTVTPLSSQD